MPNPITGIALQANPGFKYVDIVDVSGIGQVGNILPAGAQIGDQVFYDEFDTKGGEITIDGGGQVTWTEGAEFDYFYYTNSQTQWGPEQRFGVLPSISYTLQGSFRPNVYLIGRLNP